MSVSSELNVTANITEVPPSRLSTAIGSAIMILWLICGLLGTILITVVILKDKKLRNIINVFIMSLYANDVLSMFLNVVIIIDSYIWVEWRAGPEMCSLMPEFSVVLTGSSLWHSALIAIHRYIVVVQNHFYKRMWKKMYVVFVLVVARVIPFACTFPSFTMNTSYYSVKLLRCVIASQHKGRTMSITLITIIVPCVIVVICYALIFGYVYRTLRHVRNTNTMIQREIQITKMFGVVFFLILLGFVPYGIVRNADRHNTLSADIYVYVTALYSAAVCSSPMVYGAMSSEIREACIDFTSKIYKCCCSKCCFRDNKKKTLAKTVLEMPTENLIQDRMNANVDIQELEKLDPEAHHENVMDEEKLTLDDNNKQMFDCSIPLNNAVQVDRKPFSDSVNNYKDTESEKQTTDTVTICDGVCQKTDILNNVNNECLL